MNKFRKKPVVIDAIRISDDAFELDHPNPEHVPGVIYNPLNRTVEIATLEGVMIGIVGDWIIRGVKGELYPCKNDIFEMTYEEDHECDFKGIGEVDNFNYVCAKCGQCC